MSNSDFHDYIINDVFSEISGVTSRKMFGGYGIYKDGIIFALIAYDVLYFKVDATNKADYEQKGSKPFTYFQGKHKATTMSYWEVPSDIFENIEEFKKWVMKAVNVSIRARNKKR